MICSDCCNAPTVENSEDYGICTSCKEHCEFYDDEEDECDECGEFEKYCDCNVEDKP